VRKKSRHDSGSGSQMMGLVGNMRKLEVQVRAFHLSFSMKKPKLCIYVFLPSVKLDVRWTPFVFLLSILLVYAERIRSCLADFVLNHIAGYCSIFWNF
jgi:hypothetical protein